MRSKITLSSELRNEKDKEEENLTSVSLVLRDCVNEGHFAERGVRSSVSNGFSLEVLRLRYCFSRIFSDFYLRKIKVISLCVNSLGFMVLVLSKIQLCKKFLLKKKRESL